MTLIDLASKALGIAAFFVGDVTATFAVYVDEHETISGWLCMSDQSPVRTVLTVDYPHRHLWCDAEATP